MAWHKPRTHRQYTVMGPVVPVHRSATGTRQWPFMSEIHDELDPPFEILDPDVVRAPVLFNSPHSGSTYPRTFLGISRLDIATLRRSEDSFVDELVAGVVRHGFPLMHAHFPRCF